MDFASVIRQGEKEYNSDFLYAEESDDGCACFAVADGRETPEGARLAVNKVAEEFDLSGVITKTSVADFFASAGAELDANEDRLHSCMAFMLTDGSVAVWGNIGDCRVYLLRENYLYEISPDHSDAYALYEAGNIRYPKIRTNKNRYKLTRMLGEGEDVKPDYSQPEVLKKGDAFLICTDGFWENIHERQVEKTLKRSKSAQDWLDRMVKVVDQNIHYKKYTRFKDSMSAITIKF